MIDLDLGGGWLFRSGRVVSLVHREYRPRDACNRTVSRDGGTLSAVGAAGEWLDRLSAPRGAPIGRIVRIPWGPQYAPPPTAASVRRRTRVEYGDSDLARAAVRGAVASGISRRVEWRRCATAIAASCAIARVTWEEGAPDPVPLAIALVLDDDTIASVGHRRGALAQLGSGRRGAGDWGAYRAAADAVILAAMCGRTRWSRSYGAVPGWRLRRDDDGYVVIDSDCGRASAAIEYGSCSRVLMEIARRIGRDAESGRLDRAQARRLMSAIDGGAV